MANSSTVKQGSLVCVGVGMMLGAHITPRARSSIEQADVVFAAVSDALVELWLQQMHGDVRSLQPLYQQGLARNRTYDAMVETLLEPVRAGKNVCGVFYGHPGVFARAPHEAIALARTEGHAALMEPGISAEDCLYADLGIDPATVGCQHYEASQFMFNARRYDPSAYLVLWQIGVAGDTSMRRAATGPGHRQLLVDLLAREYPLDHEVIAYEAATLPIATARIEGMPLADLVHATLHLHTTLVIPPAHAMRPDQAMIDAIAALDATRDHAG